jgi:hypothetical protein
LSCCCCFLLFQQQLQLVLIRRRGAHDGVHAQAALRSLEMTMPGNFLNCIMRGFSLTACAAADVVAADPKHGNQSWSKLVSGCKAGKRLAAAWGKPGYCLLVVLLSSYGEC